MTSFAAKISKSDADLLSAIFALLLIVFVRMMPPFIGAGTNELFIKLSLEVCVLGGMSVYLLMRNRLTPLIYLSIILVLYLMNWVLSAEQIRQVLSHFNKFALLLLLSEVLILSYPLASFLKKVWCAVWFVFPILSILVFFTHVSGLYKLINFGGNHNYYYFPYLGYTVMKLMDNGFAIPRYAGFLNEPIQFGFFAGFNMVVANRLFWSKRNAGIFFVLNMVAGLLTFSYAFYMFLTIYLFLWRYISKIPSKYIFIGAFLFIVFAAGIGAELISLPHSSLGDRLKRYQMSLMYIQRLHLDEYLSGAGIIQFQSTIGRGSSSALIDVIVSRGVIIFFAWAYLLHERCRYVPGLIFYIVFYSLFTSLWVFPFFVAGVAIATSFSQIRMAILEESKKTRTAVPAVVRAN